VVEGIWLVGGAELAGALYHEIDELVLKINPVTARAGITGSTSRRFTRPEPVTLDSGVTSLTYTANEVS
jgi:hypothetical protein